MTCHKICSSVRLITYDSFVVLCCRFVAYEVAVVNLHLSVAEVQIFAEVWSSYI